MSNKYDSRKYKLTKGILIASTLAFIIPPVLTFWFLPQPLVLMSAVEYISLVTGTLAIYNGSNVIEKKIAAPEVGEK